MIKISKDKKSKTFYFIKWWKSQGILKLTTHDYTDNRVWIDSFSSAKLGEEVFTVEENARHRLGVLIAKEMVSLRNRIKKLSKIDVKQIEVIDFKIGNRFRSGA